MIDFNAENGAGASDELLRLAEENSMAAARTPTLTPGQVWVDGAGVEVTVLDFAEFTCGWMVRVAGATPDLIPEDEFRSAYVASLRPASFQC